MHLIPDNHQKIIALCKKHRVNTVNSILSELAEILHQEKCSCVISSQGKITICRERGIKDLYKILQTTPDLLHDAYIADKVVGKGAAALMVLGGINAVYTNVISDAALALLRSAAIYVSYKTSVPNIINRSGNGICPVEALCKDCTTATECLPLIEGFINPSLNQQNTKV